MAKRFKDFLGYEILNEETLEEALVQPIETHYNHELSKEYAKIAPHVSELAVHQGTHLGQNFNFIHLKHNGMHEVHIVDASNPASVTLTGSIARHKVPVRIYATAVNFYKRHLDRSRPIRIQAGSEDSHQTYHKIVSHLLKRHYPNRFDIVDRGHQPAADGGSYPTLEVIPKLVKSGWGDIHRKAMSAQNK